MATVNATEFGRLFNMTSQRVGDLINQGMPAGKAGHRGSPRQIDIPLAVDWLITRAVARIRRPDGKESLEDAETRLKRASADLAEIRAAEAANRTVGRPRRVTPIPPRRSRPRWPPTRRSASLRTCTG